MKELESYSIDELEQMTGTNRRTISYYIAEGVLPKVGRRGPKTRYGREFVDRLNFVSRAKELQDAGKLPSVRLDEMAVLLDALPGELIAEGSKANRRLIDIFAEHYRPMDVTKQDVFDEPSPDGSMHEDFLYQEDLISEPDAGFDKQELVYQLTGSAMASSSERREMAQRRAPDSELRVMSMSADTSAQDELAERAIALNAQVSEILGQTQDMQQQSAEAFEDIRLRTHEELREMQRMLKEMHQLRTHFTEEVRELRATIEELQSLKGLQKPDGRVRNREDVLQSRADVWAKRFGIPRYRLKIARLVNNPVMDGGGVWCVTLDPKQLPVDEDLVVLFEPEPEDDNMRGRLRGWTINSEELFMQIPVLQKISEDGRVTLQFSKGLKGMMQVDNCPGMHLRGMPLHPRVKPRSTRPSAKDKT